MTTQILLIEDDPDLSTLLHQQLESEGYLVRLATTGREGLERSIEKPLPDFIVLDVGLPDITGVDVCRQLRGFGPTRHVPILMLTAKDSEPDRVLGFEAGADDYVVKPFYPRELLLRIEAILRRPRALTTAPDQEEFGCLRVDRVAHQAWVEGEEISLTPLEFRLLNTLMVNRGQVLNRTMLLDTVWGTQVNIQARTVDAHLNRLREKIKAAGRYIETLRGVGYRFRTNPSRRALPEPDEE
ncbi:MAG: response regulator transcription factor [Magnetococcus sp. WYHC-3]